MDFRGQTQISLTQMTYPQILHLQKCEQSSQTTLFYDEVILKPSLYDSVIALHVCIM